MRALTEQEIRRIAAEACLDPRTVRRVLVNGEPPRSLATSRVLVAALRALGFMAHAKKVERHVAA